MYTDLESQIAAKSNDELVRIYTNPDHFQTRFVELAKEELNLRGVDLTDYELLKKQRQELLQVQLEKGVKGNSTLIIIGFISALLGGLIGIIAGFIYSHSKHKDIGDGSYYIYGKSTRDQGAIMMALGICVLLFSLGYKYLN